MRIVSIVKIWQYLENPISTVCGCDCKYSQLLNALIVHTICFSVTRTEARNWWTILCNLNMLRNQPPITLIIEDKRVGLNPQLYVEGDHSVHWTCLKDWWQLHAHILFMVVVASVLELQLQFCWGKVHGCSSTRKPSLYQQQQQKLRCKTGYSFAAINWLCSDKMTPVSAMMY